MSGLKRLQPGEYSDGIPGKTWNALVDGEVRDRAKGPPNIRGPQGGNDSDSPNPVRVLVKNDSGSEVPTGGVLRLTGVAQEPADFPGCEYAGPIFTGETPEDDDPDQQVAVIAEPVSDGFLQWGAIAGAAWAKVNVTDAGHAFAKPKASVDELESDASTGFPIIWKEIGTGTGKWAVVSLAAPIKSFNVIHALAKGAVTDTDATFTVDNIVLRNGVDPREDPGDSAEELEVDNDFGFTIDDNGLIRAEQADDGTWECTQAKCPE